MIQLNPVDRARLEASIADQQTVLDFEQLFEAVIELQTQVGAYIAQPGDIVYTAAATRAQALPANGASLLRAGYPALFAAIGTQYGAADGTHFNVPNCAGRVIAGKEAAENLITTAVSGFSGATLGAVGGLQSHTLVATEMPSHAHLQTSDMIRAVGAGNVAAGGGLAHNFVAAINTGSAGGDGAHRNVQPTIILNAFILY